ncbi:MAG: type II secretion system GspH family protein [Oscillospiraceae bacterium]|nr:type II secretion system GspH family protein [Oscillospiraceae bacterium]
MLNNYKGLYGKRGFTLIEMIIVVSIIAIMSAVAVPNFIMSQRRAEANRQNENARGFYFALQSMLLNTMEDDNTESEFFLTIDGVTRRRSSPIVKFPSNIAPIAEQSGLEFYLFATMDNDGTFSTATLGKSAAASDIAEFPSSGSTNDGIFGTMLDEILGYMANDGEVGYYYAMFDSQFRVAMVYYSKFATPAVVSAAAYDFGSNNLIGGQIFGAFPIQYGFKDNFKIYVGGEKTPVAPTKGPTYKWFDVIEVYGSPI